MHLTLPTSKTDRFRKGIRLTIVPSGDQACPVTARRRLHQVDSHRPHRAPLLSIGETCQDSFTREYVVAKLQQLALLAGLGQGTWNRYSFQKGLQPGLRSCACPQMRSRHSAGGDPTLTSPLSNTRAKSELPSLSAVNTTSHRAPPASNAHQPALRWEGCVTTARQACLHVGHLTCLIFGIQGW